MLVVTKTTFPIFDVATAVCVCSIAAIFVAVNVTTVINCPARARGGGGGGEFDRCGCSLIIAMMELTMSRHDGFAIFQRIVRYV